jgi:hypothetical protein
MDVLRDSPIVKGERSNPRKTLTTIKSADVVPVLILIVGSF